ncbi:hypothetical protein AB0P17_12565 [Streptomyces sp. NPDC088124]|uniref:hypothetical protein n=1 Tax=Streptomyces sp. NPDC088124 TaxID=3154654 RepID=UPI0034462908
MAPHHHAYLWHGHGTILVRPGDAHRRPGHPEFPTAPVMPLEPAHWLLKSHAHIRATFTHPAEAAHWYTDRIRQHTPILTGSYAPAPAPDEITRRLTAREDLTGGWWTTGQRFLSLSLVACDPHPRHPGHPCPARRHRGER